MKLALDQEAVMIDIMGGKNVFISGNAGTGKSFLVNHISQQIPCTRVAPTGLAAANISGQTIHSKFSMNIGFLDPEDDYRIYNARLRRNLERVKTIIIDEISMVRSDLFRALDLKLRTFNPNLPFGGKQIIVVGDFFQLPPVIVGSERDLFTDKGYSFESLSWSEFAPVHHHLTTPHRQKDKAHETALDAIGIGDVSGLDYMNNAAQFVVNSAEVPEEAIFLTPTNAMVDKFNEARLGKLPGRLQTLLPLISGQDKSQPKHTLKIKVGARVMTTVNNPISGYCNGDCGTIMRIADRHIQVKFDNNKTINITRLEEHVTAIIKGERVPVGIISQYPLRLAFALTIHKSQGLSLDSVCLCIPRKTRMLNTGQLYVALSRLKDPTQMYLTDSLKPWMVNCDSSVMEFMNV